MVKHVVAMFTWVLLLIQLMPFSGTSTESNFVVVVDMGSSGSRVFVYEYSVEGRVIGSKGLKVSPGVSSFVGDHPRAAAEYLRPLFEHAAKIVPPELHKTTPLHLKATAGMRLLSQANQDTFFQGLFASLTQSDYGWNPFFFPAHHLGTIDGDDEAYFAALSVNFLGDRIDSGLQPVDASPAVGGVPPLGALDLGGASMQIVFQPIVPGGNGGAKKELMLHAKASEDNNGSTTPAKIPSVSSGVVASALLSTSSATASAVPSCSTATATAAAAEGPGWVGNVDVGETQAPLEKKEPSSSKSDDRRTHTSTTVSSAVPTLGRSDLFTHSFLSFGADQVRQRLWGNLAERTSSPAVSHEAVEKDADSADNDQQQQQQGVSAGFRRQVGNPCGFKGHVVEWAGVELVGTGESEACAEEVRLVLFDPSQCAVARKDGKEGGAEVEDEARRRLDRTSCPLAGFRGLPSVSGVDFVAMSVYFFALDCVRVLGRMIVSLGDGKLERGSESPLPTPLRSDANAASAGTATTAAAAAAAAATHQAAFEAHWPNPSLGELEAASASFCAADWATVSAPGFGDAHAWTWLESQLPHRCFDAVFIAALLADGLGFDRGARQVAYVRDLSGTEVEWTLGFALASKSNTPL